MGIAYSAARRAVNNWNVTNRAVRFLDKTTTKRKLEWKSPKTLNEVEKQIHMRNPKLEEQVGSFSISSVPIKDSILPEGCDYVVKSYRRLPQRFELGSPLPPPHIEFGFAIPEVIPSGKITMRQAINLVKDYQRKLKTVPELSKIYTLDNELTSSICKYFTLFEKGNDSVWVPPSGKSSEDEKPLLDQAIFSEDVRIPEEGVSRYIRINELNSPQT